MEHSAEPHTQAAWPTAVTALTLFVDDVDRAREFYLRAFGLPVHYSDDVSVVFAVGGTLMNLLATSAAGELVEPGEVGAGGQGYRAVMTLGVDDVDAVCQRLTEAGIDLLNGPMDRPWGVRTASFHDPDGHLWEIAK